MLFFFEVSLVDLLNDIVFSAIARSSTVAWQADQSPLIVSICTSSAAPCSLVKCVSRSSGEVFSMIVLTICMVSMAYILMKQEWKYPKKGMSKMYFRSSGYRAKWPMYLTTRQRRTTQIANTILTIRRSSSSSEAVTCQNSQSMEASYSRAQLDNVVWKTANVLHGCRLSHVK